jgi:hypothetical protein
MKKRWLVLFGALIILSIDIWNWNTSQPILSFMPFWTWHIVILIFSYSLSFALFVKYEWRDS